MKMQKSVKASLRAARIQRSRKNLLSPTGSMLEHMEPRRLFSTFTVNTLQDGVGLGVNVVSLRQAVNSANSHAGADTINFSPAVFPSASLHTITLTQGQLTLNDTTGATTITGPGSQALAISGNNKVRIFKVDANATATLTRMTIKNGLSTASFGGAGGGGGILNYGRLTLNTVIVTGNTAQGGSSTTQDGGIGEGGGIVNAGELSLSGCTVSLNKAIGGAGIGGGNSPGDAISGGEASGAGIDSFGTLTVTNSTISGNTATGGVGGTYGLGGDADGGGILATSLMLSGSTISNNTANGSSNDGGNDAGHAQGGGIWTNGFLNITNSSITGNAANGGIGSQNLTADGSGGDASGGGVYSKGDVLSLTGSDVSGNHANGGDAAFLGSASGAASGGGIFNGSGTLTILSSTLNQNSATGGDGGGQTCPGGNAFGGAIDSGGDLNVTASTINKNTATGGLGGEDSPTNVSEATASGGGIYSGGTLELLTTTISGNSAIGGEDHTGYGATGGYAYGGGVSAQAATSITRSTISSNQALGGNGDNGEAGLSSHGGDGGTAYGGGIDNEGGITLVDSTIAINTATGGDGGSGDGTFSQTNGGDGSNGLGAGIYNAAPLLIYNSTISGNTAGGGAAGAAADASYVDGNTGAGVGGGIDVTGGQAPSLSDTIVSDNFFNSSFDDIAGTVLDTSSFNLIGVGGGLNNNINGNIVGVTDPGLMSLSDNGGPTFTFAPQVGSPAIDAGSNGVIFSGLTVDQRGFKRIVGSSVDIGAVENANSAISGFVFQAVSGTQTPLSSITVYNDANNNGKFDGGELHTATNGSGHYSLTNIGAGNYKIRIVLPANYQQITPASGFGYTLALGPDQSLTGKNFIAQITGASISGTVFNDTNGDKKQDNSETGLVGWTVYLDLDNSGIVKAADPKTMTDANGHYSFAHVSAGAYIVRVIRPANWQQTSPAGGLGQHITLSTNQTLAGINFGEQTSAV